MTTSTMEIYEALVQAGVDQERAKAAAAVVVSKSEIENFVSQDNLSSVKNELVAEIRNSRATTLQWVATMLVGQAAAITALQNLI